MAAIDINVLHRRMGHIGIDRLQRMVTKGQLKDIDTVLGSPQLCEPCVLGKLKKLPFKHEESQRTTRPLERVHSDVGGPVDVRSREGYSYWITFIDEHTRFVWIRFLKKKSDAQAAYNDWKSAVQDHFKTTLTDIEFSQNFISFFQTDNGASTLAKSLKSSFVEMEQSTKLQHPTPQSRMEWLNA